MKSYGVIIQIKLLTQYFHSTLFILYVALDEIFWCVHSNETLWAVVSRSGDYFPLTFENEILQVKGWLGNNAVHEEQEAVYILKREEIWNDLWTFCRKIKFK